MKDFSQYVLACRPDEGTRHRDRLKAAAPVPLPIRAMVKFQSPVNDQGQRSCCTGESGAGFMEQVLHSRGIAQDIRLSPFFPWYYARLLEGVQDKDEGVQMRTMMKVLTRYGICPLEFWDVEMPINVEPDNAAQTYGAALTIPAYERCEDVRSLKYSIAIEDQTVMIGVPVFKNWFDTLPTRTGIIPYTGSGVPEGGHAICAVGYDDEIKAPGNEPGVIICRNSWGEGYGDRGYIYLPYDMFDAEQFDGWTAGYESLRDPK